MILQGDGSIVRWMPWNLESPTDAEDADIMFTPVRLTVSELIHKVRSGTQLATVTWTLRFDADRDAVGTELIVGGLTSTDANGSITSFSNAVIPAGSWLWAESSAVVDVPANLGIALVFA